jgi:phosphohistidine phosphatase SixA
VRPAAIATSPLVRCRQTADILTKHLAGRPEVVELAELAPGSEIDPLLEWSAGQAGDVAWVGHAPDVSRLLADLVGGDGNAFHCAKGACAAVECDPAPARGAGTLCWHVTAKMLGC